MRAGRLVESLGDRNLAQVRMDPDAGSFLGIIVFDRNFEHEQMFRRLFDDTVFSPQEPDDGLDGRSICPDCGGSGRLRDSIGKFVNFQVQRKSFSIATHGK